MLERATPPDIERAAASMDPSRLAALEESLLRSLPCDLDASEQEASLALCRLLASGEPVREVELAGFLDVSVRRTADLLEGLPEISWEDDLITGHLGLSQRPTAHRIEADGRTLHAWCAWDTLFLPELLQRTARVRSVCPVSGDEIELKVTPKAIETVEPAAVVLSFREPTPPKACRSIRESFCCNVSFFTDARSGETWTGDHPGTFLLSLDSAFELGRRFNAARYPDLVLAEDSSGSVEPRAKGSADE